MRGTVFALVSLALCLAGSTPVRAGFYNPAEPVASANSGLRFEDFQNNLKAVRALDVPNGSERRTLQESVRKLQAKAATGLIWTDELISLSAYEMLLRDYERAIQALKQAEASEPDNFMVLANLATAYHLLSQPERAVFYQEKVVKRLSEVCPGWTAAQLQWPRRVESFFLKYLYLRLQESRRPPVRGGEELAPVTDALFPGLRFSGPDGDYPLGRLAAAQEARLPTDAVAVVEQLLLALPHDPDLRLNWLLAEVLNARGNVPDAARVLDDLVFNRGLQAREARRHKQVLSQARETALAAQDLRVLYWLTPRPLSPGADHFFAEAVVLEARPEVLRRQNSALSDTGSDTPPPREDGRAVPAPAERAPAKPAPSYLPSEPRLLIVGAVGLALIVALAYWQGFLVGRRRQRAPAAKE